MKKILKTNNITTVVTATSIAISKGENVPIVKIKNIQNFLEKLKSNPNISEGKANLIISNIYFNNRRKIRELKLKNQKKHIQNLIKKHTKRKFHNASALKTKYSFTDIQQAEDIVYAANLKVAEIQGLLNNAETNYTAEKKDYDTCKSGIFCNAKKQKPNVDAWFYTLKQRQRDLELARADYQKAQIELSNMRIANNDFIGLQEDENNEIRARQEENRKQELHEAELIKYGSNAQIALAEIAKQMTEIEKLEAETAKITQEDKAIQTASDNKTFGTSTTIVNEGMSDTVKWIIGGAAFLLTAGSIYYIILK